MSFARIPFVLQTGFLRAQLREPSPSPALSRLVSDSRDSTKDVQICSRSVTISVRQLHVGLDQPGEVPGCSEVEVLSVPGREQTRIFAFTSASDVGRGRRSLARGPRWT